MRPKICKKLRILWVTQTVPNIPKMISHLHIELKAALQLVS